ncbi:MAG: hypothetical protein GY827_04535 [Cytophagales bacterium]|nr:hypothetical protein [Cytophagales bacterium]
MKKVEIYEFQLESIYNALRLTANIHDSRSQRKEGQTSFDRQVRQSEQYAKNALVGNIDTRVDYMGGPEFTEEKMFSLDKVIELCRSAVYNSAGMTHHYPDGTVEKIDNDEFERFLKEYKLKL